MSPIPLLIRKKQKMSRIIKHIIAHRVGNKLRGEGVGFSSKEMDSEVLSSDLLRLIDKSFKGDDFYHFYGEYDLGANPVYSFAKTIFENPDDFKSQSNHIAKSLYESSVHPKVMTGELCVIYISDVECDNVTTDAIAIIKSESYQEVLQFEWGANGYVARKSMGISLSKIDKGALIYNISPSDGYRILIVDKTKRRGDTKYWKKRFLQVKSCNSSSHQTVNLVETCREFIRQNIKDSDKYTRLEKAMIANRAKDVLLHTDAESISLEDYSREVFRDNQLASQFGEFVASSDKANEMNLEKFEIVKSSVVKRKDPVSTIKLDDNFELYINGAEDRISKGYDPDAALNFYKLYFEKEQ